VRIDSGTQHPGHANHAQIHASRGFGSNCTSRTVPATDSLHSLKVPLQVSNTSYVYGLVLTVTVTYGIRWHHAKLEAAMPLGDVDAAVSAAVPFICHAESNSKRGCAGSSWLVESPALARD
jgi:hypothetical protein